MDITPSAFWPLYTEERKYNEKTHEMLWHYTSTAGTMGIVQPEKDSLKFWFTRSDCLNDKSEGQDILICLREVADELLKEKVIDQTLYDFICRRDNPKVHFFSYPYYDESQKEEEMKFGSMLTAGECESFICCFSTAKDQLDMWRYYSKTEDGYSIGLWSSLLFHKQFEFNYSDTIENSQALITLKGMPVIYEKEKKKSFIRDRITKAVKLYEDEKKNRGSEKAHNALNSYLDFMLQENQYRFKHECFANEKEYRFVAIRPQKKPESSQNDLPIVKYRNQNNTITPYIELSCDKNALWEVQVSPYNKSDHAVQVCKDYLGACGIRNGIVVTKSELPVRE